MQYCTYIRISLAILLHIPALITVKCSSVFFFLCKYKHYFQVFNQLKVNNFNKNKPIIILLIPIAISYSLVFGNLFVSFSIFFSSPDTRRSIFLISSASGSSSGLIPRLPSISRKHKIVVLTFCTTSKNDHFRDLTKMVI